MKEPKKVTDFLEHRKSNDATEKLNESLKALRGLLEYGEIKLLARKHKIPHLRAYDILQGRLKIQDSDNAFINACIDRALPRKQRNEKLKQFLT